MNRKRLVLAIIAAFLLQGIAGTVWHVIVFKDLYAESMAKVARPEPMMGAVLLAILVRAVLMAWIYPVGYKGGAPWREGARFGVVMGLLSGTIIAILYGNASFGAGWLWADLAYFIVEGAIVGIAIAYCYGGRAR